MSTISINNLEKKYGKNYGTRDVTFSVNEGEIYGFVGPNGAGKSTTIKVLMGFIYSSKGSASIMGLDVVEDTKKIKAFTGYVPSDVNMYSNMSVKELLKRNTKFYDGDYNDEVKRLVSLFEVDVNKSFDELSTGNKKKVSIICALMASPKVVILDEPTSGLDPMMQKTLLDELKRRAKLGTTILLSSHNLTEVQEYCDKVAFIKSGRIIAVIDPRSTSDRYKKITVVGGERVDIEGFDVISEDEGVVVYRTLCDSKVILKMINKINPEDFTVENESMEEYFWDLYKMEEGQ